MKKSTEKTLKYVGIGAVGVYLLSKVQGGNNPLSIITDPINDAIKTVVTTITAGAGDIVGDTAKTLAWDAPSSFGTGILTPFVNLFAGAGTGEEWTKTGNEVIDKEGLGVVFWSRDRINQYVMPNAEKNPYSGSYSYVSPQYQGVAANMSILRRYGYSEEDIGNYYSVAKDVETGRPTSANIVSWINTLKSEGMTKAETRKMIFDLQGDPPKGFDTRLNEIYGVT
jgi:hypothetical protein